MSPDVFAVVEAVAGERRIPIEAVFGRRRFTYLVAARAEVYRRLHERGWTFSAIGREFDRDHATIMHALKEPRLPPPPTEIEAVHAELRSLAARLDALERRFTEQDRGALDADFGSMKE